jgi:hypothetical protein
VGQSLAVRRPLRWRNDQLHKLSANDLGTTVAEGLFGCRIEFHHIAFVVHDDDAIQGGLEHGAFLTIGNTINEVHAVRGSPTARLVPMLLGWGRSIVPRCASAMSVAMHGPKLGAGAAENAVKLGDAISTEMNSRTALGFESVAMRATSPELNHHRLYLIPAHLIVACAALKYRAIGSRR